MRRVFFILSVLLFAACSESLDIQLEPEVQVYPGIDSDRRIRLTPQDEEYQVLNEWLSEHRSGWYATSGHYSGGVYIKSGSYGIQVTETHVVLYSAARPEPKAMYIQKVGKGELSEIGNVGK